MALRLASRAGVFALIALFAGACSSETSEGDSDSTNGGTRATTGGAGGSGAGGTNATGGSGAQSPSVDCAGVCERVRTICAGQSTITDTWVDVCTSACDARVQLTPDVAVLERDCVMAAVTCTVAVMCVASPTG